jgi:hypothetical protein
MPRQYTLPSQPGLYSERVIPEIPRVRRLRAGKLCRHPLVVYSAFVTVSLLLLGSMAVASLPN